MLYLTGTYAVSYVHRGSRVLSHVYVPCQRRQSQGRRAIRHLARDPEGDGICLKIPPGNWGGLRRGAPLLRIGLPTETHEPTRKSAKQTISCRMSTQSGSPCPVFPPPFQHLGLAFPQHLSMYLAAGMGTMRCPHLSTSPVSHWKKTMPRKSPMS
jgi:hypothetical protein